jgi:citrate lyase subunit beta/citryl-CoA lyase
VALREASRLDSVIVPKVGSIDDVATVEATLEGAVGIEVLIETAAGLAAVGDIASSSPRVVALVFGPLDLGASLGIHSLDGVRVEGFEGDVWFAARFQILVAARAAGARAIDGPFPLLDDTDGLRAAAGRARALGYDGKWVIHPSQIDVVNEVFTPTAQEIERARDVLRAFDASPGAGSAGAVRLDDLMVDEASRRVAEAVLARARAAGLS